MSKQADNQQLRREAAHNNRHVAVYLRVSTDEQVHAYDLDVQRDQCLAMAAAKGLAVSSDYIFCDEGITGTADVTDRPALAALLGAVERGEIGTVIVLALDRLGRHTHSVLDLVEQLATHGVQLVTCKELLDTSTPAGSSVLSILAALAHLEGDTTVEGSIEQPDERARRDSDKDEHVPFGYLRRADGRIDVDPFTAMVVRSIIAWRTNDKLPLRDIAERLNYAGYNPPHGKRWNTSSVKEILDTLQVYRGGQHNESGIYWPAIV